MEKHTENFSWVYYVFTGPAFTIEQFFEFIKGYLDQNVNPEKKLEELKARKARIEKLRKECIKKLKPDKFNEMILNLVGKLVWAKPRRKDYQSRSYYHLEKLMREIAKRLYISLNQARSAPLNVLREGFKTGKVDLDTINSIDKFHICVQDGKGDVSIIHGKAAEEFYGKNIEKEESKDMKDVNEIKGVCAYAGNAKGIVKIVNRPVDMKKMNQGDILVSAATTPSVVPAMKKAAAIVTDEGGLTCHASIVSRELEIPCVIGTKIATEVLKEGYEVEVDAGNGIVRILNKQK